MIDEIVMLSYYNKHIVCYLVMHKTVIGIFISMFSHFNRPSYGIY